MKKTKFKKGDIVYWQDLQGEVIDINSGNYPVIVKFINNHTNDFTNDGRCYVDTPLVLSHTPYTLNGFTQNGFTQNEVIEKDTLVWVWDNNDIVWQQMFYSHFKDGKHYCFTNQQTSKESNDTIAWDFLETTNPLIK
jgi:hypothetical protein